MGGGVPRLRKRDGRNKEIVRGRDTTEGLGSRRKGGRAMLWTETAKQDQNKNRLKER